MSEDGDIILADERSMIERVRSQIEEMTRPQELVNYAHGDLRCSPNLISASSPRNNLKGGWEGNLSRDCPVIQPKKTLQYIPGNSTKVLNNQVSCL